MSGKIFGGASRRRAIGRLLTVAMALAMVASVFAGGVLAQESTTGADAADEVYVTEEGDAVLVYEGAEANAATGQYGVDVTEGIVYVLLTDELEEDVSAAFDLWAAPDAVSGSGEIAVDRPEDLEALSMNVSGVHTDEESSFDADVELTVPDDSRADDGSMYFDEATAEGSTESSADHVSSTGEFAVRMHDPQGTAGPTERLDLSVSGEGGDYALEVREQRPLEGFEVEQWENETAAKRTLEERFGATADDLGGAADVTIDEYALDDESRDRPVLDVEYTVEYEGLDGIAQLLAADLADDPELDLTAEEAEALADAALGVELDPVEVSVAADESTVEGEWTVEVGNTAPLTESLIDRFESVVAEDDDLAELGLVEDLRASHEAQVESGLVRTTEWEGELASDDPETLTLSASLSSDAENWATYVDELEERGIEQQFDLSVEGHGETVGDEIEFELAVGVGHDDGFDAALGALTGELEDEGSVGEGELEVWRALEDAGFQIAGIDVDATDGTVTITAGAEFDDLEAFQGLVEDEFHGHSVTHAYADLTEDGQNGYLYVEELVDGDATEADVRATEFVGEETTVHLDASLEERPRLDTATADEFLDTEVTADVTADGDGEAADGEGNETDDAGNVTESDAAGNETDTDDGDEVPGFGVVAAVAVLLSVALLRTRD